MKLQRRHVAKDCPLLAGVRSPHTWGLRQAVVCALVHKLQILYAVVVLDSVPVMHYLVLLQVAVQVFGHDQPVSHHIAVLGCHRVIRHVPDHVPLETPHIAQLAILRAHRLRSAYLAAEAARSRRSIRPELRPATFAIACRCHDHRRVRALLAAEPASFHIVPRLEYLAAVLAWSRFHRAAWCYAHAPYYNSIRRRIHWVASPSGSGTASGQGA
jgi:hypothetical protein